MKKLIYSVCIVSLMLSCSTDPEIDYALIKGQVDNPKTEIITIFKGREKLKEIVITQDGSFADTLRVSDGYYGLSHGNESSSVYFAPGYDLNITFNTQEFDESIRYEGAGSQINNYLAQKYLEHEKAVGDVPAYYSLDESDYAEKALAMKNMDLQALENAGITDQKFIDLETDNLKYEHFNILNKYESYHAYYAKKDGFKVSDDFLPAEIKTMAFDDEQTYTQIPSYNSLANSQMSDKIYEAIGDDYQNARVDHFDVLAQAKIPALKNDIISGMGSFLVSPANPNMADLYNFFIENLSDEDIKAKLTEKFNRNKNLMKGMPSPQFTQYENHKGGTTSLVELKGKYVYIDVWATWCAPCIREVPYLKEIESSYHDRNIEFVSTSIDKAADHNKWIDMVKDKSLGGIQLFADNDWNSKFIKDYAIEGIPRFILVDPDGNIVSADAPRPSNPKLVKLFEALKL
ncbi:MAG: TlpA family protein disulfide reductase [Bacteroidia bacterium]|nr:TlpA family protein disulfide reductase [Bacteroidia bacterium]